MTAVGGWIRYGSVFGDIPSGGAYAGVLVGQCVSALAQPFFTNIPAMVASRWFPVKERDLATVVGALFNGIGVAIGTVVASAFVTQSSPTEVDGMPDWMLFQALFSTISAVLATLLFKDRPPTPASQSQESTVFSQIDGDSSKNFRAALSFSFQKSLECFSERDFCWLFVAFGIGLGLFNALSTVIEQITAPVCATSDDASLFGGLLIGLGLIGAGILGCFLDRSHRYRLALIGGFGGAAVFVVILTLVLREGMINGIAVAFAFLGFFMVPM